MKPRRIEESVTALRGSSSDAMWLLPVLARLSSLAARIYYRFTVDGMPPAATGPLLLVANHPNSLVDPGFVAAAAGRPVRFLAKAPLFTDRKVGWLVRGAGAIPVYRRQDDPTLMRKNLDTFAAAIEALAGGAAVGIFPEGMSHSAPAMATLRTGAARLALGAAGRGAGAFPIVPVGIVLRHKVRFRSAALAVVGEVVEWSDLARRVNAGPEAGEDTDSEAVRTLTRRIEACLRDVTVNLQSWEDAPVVECAEAIYAAELGLPTAPAERLRRLRQVTESLSRLRREDPERAQALVAAVARFAGTLAVLGAAPADLDRPVPPGRAAAWVARRLGFFLLGGPVGLLGMCVFLIPYQLTGYVGSRPGLDPDVRATYKLLGGALFYLLWVLLLAMVALAAGGPRWALAAIVGLPSLALVTLAVRERWGDARAELMRFLKLGRRADLRGRLLSRRHSLGRALENLREELAGEQGGMAGE